MTGPRTAGTSSATLNEEWELTLYRYNSNVVRQVNQKRGRWPRQSKALHGLETRTGVRFVERKRRRLDARGTTGSGPVTCTPTRSGGPPRTCTTNAISVNSMHRIPGGGRTSRLYNLTLTEEVPGFDGGRAPGRPGAPTRRGQGGA